MQLKKAIAQADMLRPNLIKEDIKAEWLYQLEGEFAELMGVETPKNAWLDGGEDPKLLMPPPHDGVYALYLCAMIDNAQQETALYANDMTVANAEISNAKAWWRRHNTPPSRKGFKVM